MRHHLLQRISWRLRPLTAHRPDRAVPGLEEGPLVVAGMFRTPNGLCQSALGCLESLQEQGLSPLAVDTSAILNQVEISPEIALSDMPRSSQGTLILHANAPETEILLFQLGLRRWHNWRVIGYWAWELPDLPDAWVPAQRLLHEVWTPSAFCTEAISARLAIPVKTVPHRVVAPGGLDIKTDDQSDEITCLVMADGHSSFERKNLLGSIALFQRAFETREDVRLIVKCRHLSDYPEAERELRTLAGRDRRLSLRTGTCSREEIWEMMAECDILLSCHRSEGFGLHLAEAMSLGKLVLATGWSGNLQFMNENNSILLPYSLIDVEDRFGIYGGLRSKWAEADLTKAADMLREIVGNPANRAAIGRNARADIARCLDGTGFSKALLEAHEPLSA